MGLGHNTKGIVSKRVIEAMPDGSIFINTSRGAIVDEEALAQAVATRGIKAGLDVFCNEPASDGDWSAPLVALAGVYGTHHIGASTEQASEAVGDEVVRIVSAWKSKGEVPNCVNLAVQTEATHLLVVRHKDEVGVLAGVLNALRVDEINVESMKNIVFSGSLAACAHIQVSQAPSTQLVDQILDNPSIFAVDVVDLESP